MRRLLVCLICAFATDTRAADPVLTPLWTAPGFANPESIALSADGEFLFVSNVDGEGDARDGKGRIDRLALDGKLLQRGWAIGLDGPKGLALRGGTLYASDITALVEIDSDDGKLIARHEVPDAGFLNDVALAPGGEVLVSDSAKSRIYALRDGKLETWLEHDLLRSINGLLPEAERLVASTMQGRLLAIDWTTRAVSVLAEGLGDGDGIAALGGGNYLVSEWPGRLFHVSAGGTASTLLDTRAQKRYLNDFLLVGDRLIVPNWEPGSVSAYHLQR